MPASRWEGCGSPQGPPSPQVHSRPCLLFDSIVFPPSPPTLVLAIPQHCCPDPSGLWLSCLSPLSLGYQENQCPLQGAPLGARRHIWALREKLCKSAPSCTAASRAPDSLLSISAELQHSRAPSYLTPPVLSPLSYSPSGHMSGPMPGQVPCGQKICHIHLEVSSLA